MTLPPITQAVWSSMLDDLQTYNSSVRRVGELTAAYEHADRACGEAASRYNQLDERDETSGEELAAADQAFEQTVFDREAVVAQMLDAERCKTAALLAMLTKAHVLAPHKVA